MYYGPTVPVSILILLHHGFTVELFKPIDLHSLTIIELVCPLYCLNSTKDLTGGSIKSSLLFVSEWLQQLSINI
jgi:hypothetical protein